MGVPTHFAQEEGVAAMKFPSETENRKRVGVPPHVPEVGGQVKVIVLRTPWRGSQGYPDLSRVGGSTPLHDSSKDYATTVLEFAGKGGKRACQRGGKRVMRGGGKGRGS